MSARLRRPRVAAPLAVLGAVPGAVLGVALLAAPLPAQPGAAVGDSLRLGALQEAAVRHDARLRQLALLDEQGRLRRRALDAERLPALALGAQAQHQSDVLSLPLRLPGVAIPAPPRDTYDAHLALRQRLLDPSREPRRRVEAARVAEARADVLAGLHDVRRAVSDAYFGALRARARRAELETGITDLEAQLAAAAQRVAAGGALPGEALALEAELVRRRQAVDEADARHAAVAVLGDLAGAAVDPAAPFALPDLADDVARARAAVDGLRARPEYERFARARDLLARRRDVLAAADRPRVAAFARAGYGQPGLDPLGRGFDEYWLAGVQLEWAPWSWGVTGRGREELALQQRVLDSEEAAFAAALRRGAATELAEVDRLERALTGDARIVGLREAALREARLRYGEGVITAAEYVDRETDLLAARLARAARRVELAEARARFLTLLGLEVR